MNYAELNNDKIKAPIEDIVRIKNIKRIFFDFAYKNYIGHLPSSLSALEILYTLYNKVANITKENASSIARDRVIISKEHCRYAQCCVLFENNLLEKDIFDGYFKNGGLLGHDLYNVVSNSDKVAAIDVSTGSLGHGLSVGLGLALANPNNVYIISGDGELQEGSCWEAIMFAGHNKMKNFNLIIDRNGQQIDNYTKNIVNSSYFASDAIKTFGFEVVECNGHDVSELEKALTTETDKPKCIIANTIKGREILPMKDELGFAKFHWSCLSEQNYKQAIMELDK